jgi:hypothetical protein
MKDFEAFDIGSWVREGLTEHVKVLLSSRRRKHLNSASVPIQLVAAASIAVYTMTTPWLSAQSQSPLTAVVAHADFRSADIIPGPPEWFWSRMAGEMKGWKPVVADVVDVEIAPFV